MGRLSQGATLATSYSSYGTYKAAAAAQPATAAAGKPNIVVIWGDDIGQSDISAYTKGTSNWAPWPCGASRLWLPEFPGCTTCALTPTKRPPLPPIPIGIGIWITFI